jgi:hypothetical protein
MDLGKYTDLPSALGFAPDKDAKISKAQLFEVFGKLPKFPTDFKLERGKTIEHDGVRDYRAQLEHRLWAKDTKLFSGASRCSWATAWSFVFT